MSNVYVAGVGMTRFGRHPERSIYDLAGDAVRQALEGLQTPYEGLIKTYQRPFTADNHEALSPDDYLMAVWKDGQLLPERAAGR